VDFVRTVMEITPVPAGPDWLYEVKQGWLSASRRARRRTVDGPLPIFRIVDPDQASLAISAYRFRYVVAAH
jgi:hypothetical protein